MMLDPKAQEGVQGLQKLRHPRATTVGQLKGPQTAPTRPISTLIMMARSCSSVMSSRFGALGSQAQLSLLCFDAPVLALASWVQPA